MHEQKEKNKGVAGKGWQHGKEAAGRGMEMGRSVQSARTIANATYKGPTTIYVD